MKRWRDGEMISPPSSGSDCGFQRMKSHRNHSGSRDHDNSFVVSQSPRRQSDDRVRVKENRRSLFFRKDLPHPPRHLLPVSARLCACHPQLDRLHCRFHILSRCFDPGLMREFKRESFKRERGQERVQEGEFKRERVQEREREFKRETD